MEGEMFPALPEPTGQVYQPALPGFYELVYEEGEIDSLNKNPYGDLISEISLIRLFIRRTLRKAGKLQDLSEIIRVLNALGLAASRLARLLEIQHKLSQGSLHSGHVIEQAILRFGRAKGIYDAD